jgi:hypothetical protein
MTTSSKNNAELAFQNTLNREAKVKKFAETFLSKHRFVSGHRFSDAAGAFTSLPL